jgi:His-Xaa-Ser system protein HxsD
LGPLAAPSRSARQAIDAVRVVAWAAALPRSILEVSPVAGPTVWMKLAAPGRGVATSRIVSDLRTTLGADRVELELDGGAFPRDAVYAAAFTFIDRCYVRLDHTDEGRLKMVLRAKVAGSLDGEALVADLRNELLGQAFRLQLTDAGREITASITAGAFGAPGGGEGEPFAADLATFDDPLGIAQSWEEKHARKPHAAEPPAEPPVEGEHGT